jgi:hypothetical protein
VFPGVAYDILELWSQRVHETRAFLVRFAVKPIQLGLKPLHFRTLLVYPLVDVVVLHGPPSQSWAGTLLSPSPVCTVYALPSLCAAAAR